MRTDALENLFLEEIQDIRSVEWQISDALARIAQGVSAQRLWQTLMQLRENTARHVERLDLIVQSMGPVRESETIYCPTVAARVRAELERTTLRARETLPSNFARLTSREAEVLQLIAEGCANKQIAGELDISVKTVEKHRQHLMAKLGLHDTAGVTRYAISAGLVEASA